MILMITKMIHDNNIILMLTKMIYDNDIILIITKNDKYLRENMLKYLPHHQEDIFYHQNNLNDILFKSYVLISCNLLCIIFILCLTTFLSIKISRYFLFFNILFTPLA